MVNYIKSNSTRMNHRVEFWRKERSTVRDELGQFPMVEKRVCTAWAHIVPNGGSASGSYADTVSANTTHKITIRARKGITPDMWMIDDMGYHYEISYISGRYDKAEVLEILAVVAE